MINARQNLISFLATISGQRAVTTGLQRMEAGTKGYAKGADKAGKSTQGFNDILV